MGKESSMEDEQSQPSRVNKSGIIPCGIIVIVVVCALVGFILGMNAWRSLDRRRNQELASGGRISLT